MATYADILKTNMSEVEPRKPVPIGTYRARVGLPKQTTTKSENPQIVLEFPLTILEARSDVDEDKLAEFGGAAELRKAKMRHSIFLTDSDGDANLFPLRKFLESVCKCDIEGMQTDEAINSVNGSIIQINVEHKPNKKDPTRVFAVIGATAPDCDD